MITYYRTSFLKILRLIKQLAEDPFGATASCLTIQEQLIQVVSRVEARIRRSKRKITLLKQELRKRRDTTDAKSISTTLKEQIYFLEMRVDEYHRVLELFRSLGDAIAFLYIDRWDIKPLSLKEASGFLTGKAGARLERKILRAIFAAGHTAILNDLTGCLRHGDITLVDEGGFRLFEVKSSRNSNARTNRQLEKLEKLSTYFETDEIENLYREGETRRRFELSSTEVRLCGELNETVRVAYSKGNCWQRVEPGLIYYAEVVATKGSQQTFQFIQEQFINAPAPLFYYLNQHKYEHHEYYPVALCLEEPQHVFDYYAGDLLLIVFIDVGYAINYFESRGLNATVSNDDKMLFHFKSAAPTNEAPAVEKFQVSRHFLGRVAVEFLSLDWWLNEVVTRFKTLIEE